ncbi:MAG: molybdopterin-dependent oxidoreductase [Candidatus Bathyarchaeia archaeon]|jgi:DMSO/TMAO reductase YedYZ molybdopterin-dependent catalytic subunit
MDARKILLLAILAIIVVAAAFVGNWVWTSLTSGPTITYNGEIRVYNGMQLGSINDFRLEAITGVQYINVSSYQLAVTGLVQNQTVYTYDDIVNNHTSYLKVVTLNCVEGWSVRALWQGVLVKDLLEEAGYDQSAQVVIFYAQDGYTTSLPLSYIVNNNIMIAYKINNVTLPAREGYPFQLVAEGKYGYKWIKWITKMEVSNDTGFRGYWESNGFPNDANLP